MPAKKNISELAFDAFLSHNSKNKPDVRQLKARLAAQGLTVWLDEDELRPGTSGQKALEAGIRESKSIVVVVGADGLGPWEDQEVRGALQLAVRDGRPIIPVLLPGCPHDDPGLPLFLSDLTYVDLRDGLSEAGIGKLFWGITGEKTNGHTADDQTNEDEDSPPEPPEHRAGKKKRPDPVFPPPPPPQLTLNQILPGCWQVHIQVPYPPGVTGQLNVEMLPNGMFNGQVMTPMGWVGVSGQWQANPLTHQIGLQGMQSNGYQTMPYIVMVQVNYFDARRITGMSNVGEQLTWQRTG